MKLSCGWETPHCREYKQPQLQIASVHYSTAKIIPKTSAHSQIIVHTDIIDDVWYIIYDVLL